MLLDHTFHFNFVCEAFAALQCEPLHRKGEPQEDSLQNCTPDIKQRPSEDALSILLERLKYLEQVFLLDLRLNVDLTCKFRKGEKSHKTWAVIQFTDQPDNQFKHFSEDKISKKSPRLPHG